MKQRQTSISKRVGLREQALARIESKEQRRAEVELKRTIESMKGVYSTQSSRQLLGPHQGALGSRSPPNATIDSVRSMNSYGRGPGFTGETQ